MSRIIIAFVLVAFFLLTGCSNYSAKNYAPSAQNVSQLRGGPEAPTVFLAPFESGEAVMKNSLCRLAGKIKLPGGQDWAGYVHEALRSELLMAERFDGEPEKADMRIEGTLQKATFNSNQGHWDLALRLEFSDGSHLREEVRYDFEPSFVGTDACDGVADAYSPAVRKLVGEVVTNPTFREQLDI